MSEQVTSMNSKPLVISSRCLGFDSCRFNGLSISSPVTDALKKHVEYITVCPEVQIGLGIPRDPLRIILRNGQPVLFQSATGIDWTQKMIRFSDQFLAGKADAGCNATFFWKLQVSMRILKRYG